jgi:hypothetical protein
VGIESTQEPHEPSLRLQRHAVKEDKTGPTVLAIRPLRACRTTSRAHSTFLKPPGNGNVRSPYEKRFFSLIRLLLRDFGVRSFAVPKSASGETALLRFGAERSAWGTRRMSGPQQDSRPGCRPGTAAPRSDTGRRAFQPDRTALMWAKLGGGRDIVSYVASLLPECAFLR